MVAEQIDCKGGMSDMRKAKYYLVAAALFCLVIFTMAGGHAFGQVTTADVIGTVTDSSGAMLSGAKITIQNTETGESHNTQTGQSGDFAFTFLQPGVYSLTVEAAGFETSKVTGMTLSAGDHTRSDAKMQVGMTTQAVEVTAVVSALQTDSSSVSNVIPEKIVQDIPLDGRNYIILVQHALGVTPGSANSTTSGTRPDDRRQTGSISSNGQSDNANNNMVDGMDNNERNIGAIILRPSIDSIQEVRVDTDNLPAELGRTTGAAINVITKAGTNSLHGTFYEFLRNTVFDANDYFAKRANVPRYKYNQNQFGGSLSGAIHKDKAFYFADIEELRLIQGQPTGLITVPTLFEEQNPGNFSDQTVTNKNNVPDPAHPGQFLPVGAPGPIIPVSQLSPVTLKLWSLFPAPNVAGAGITNNYSNSPTKTYFSTTVDSRVDYHFHNGDSTFVRYSYQPISSVTPGYLPEVDGVLPGGGSYPGPNKTTSQGVQLHYVHSFSTTIVAEAGIGFARLNLATEPLNYGHAVDTAFGIPNGNLDTHSSGLSPIVISGYASGLGDANYVPIFDINNVFQETGAVNFTFGAHNIKVGGAIVRRQMNYVQYPYAKGEFDFAYGSTLASADHFLQGTPSTIYRGNPQPNFFGLRMWEPSAYAQDNWRATKTLTLNLGLRWDFYSPITEAHNNRSEFDLNTLRLIVATPSNPAASVQPKYFDYAPRFGFALAAGPGLVVRGGYGIVFTPRDGTFAITPLNQPYYFLVSCNPGSTNTGLACPAGLGNIAAGPQVPTFGSINPLRGTVYGRQLDYKTSYIEEANLTVQKAFGQTVLTASYVGSFGRHLSASVYPDNPDPAPGPLPAYRYAQEFPLVNKLYLFYSTAFSNYNSGQFSAERRYSHGLTMNANFTWAHGLSDGAGALYGDPLYDYGPYGTAHNFNLLGVYTIPSIHSGNGIEKAALSGWALNASAYWRAGAYYTVMDTAYNPALINIPGQTSDRPNRVPGVNINAGRSKSVGFNLAAFAAQPQGTVGNEGAGILRAPPTRQLDTSLSKEIPIHERLTLQFRAEAFNVTNTENFAAPNANIAGWLPNNTPNPAVGGPGLITSTLLGVSPRVFQFALKGTF
jgi:hypothetical protein